MYKKINKQTKNDARTDALRLFAAGLADGALGRVAAAAAARPAVGVDPAQHQHVEQVAHAAFLQHRLYVVLQLVTTMMTSWKNGIFVLNWNCVYIPIRRLKRKNLLLAQNSEL